MATQEIVLGTDSGTFWTGRDQEPWLDDPREAKVFASPRQAWRVAMDIQETQAGYLEGSPVELHVRDPEKPRLTRLVTSLANVNNRPRLRTHWRRGFGEALPPDMPVPPAEQDGVSRLDEYLRDVDWDVIRVRQGNTPERADDLGLDQAFRNELALLSRRDPAASLDLWQTHAPADFPKSLLDDLVRQEPSSAQQVPAATNPTSPDRAPEANEITRSRDRKRDDAPLSPLATTREGPASMEPDTRQTSPLPAFVRRHFVHTGDQFYYRQTPERLAFTARGETFRAEDTSVSVATALVELAESRGWSALRVKGSQEFRRLVWAAAAKRGLSVEGYSPSAGERAILDQEPEPRDERRDAERAQSRTGGRERNRPGDPLVGVLVNHGAAPYQHEKGNSPSYFVSLRGPSGEVANHWGLDLERALGESGAAIGDQMQLARLGKQRVQVHDPKLNDAGVVIDYETKEVDRSAWSVTIRKRCSPERVGADPKGRGQRDSADPIASKVVEIFTSERLAQFPPEDQVRFRDLYNQAKAQLEAQDRLPEPPKPPNEVSRHRHRERAARGR